jgi:hypothetical protein
LILTMLISACQANLGGVTTARKPGTAKPAAGTIKPATGAGVVAPGSGNVIAGGGANVDPNEPVTKLLGTLKMDASYVIAAGGGNVIAPGGGNVIAPGGGNVIAPGGGNVIAAGGGNLIMVGGNVIAAGGGNVIAPGGGNYRTLAINPFAVTAAIGQRPVAAAIGQRPVAAAIGQRPVAAAIEVPFGEVLLAKGMVVVPVSLRTGLPIGPAVLTDEAGRYSVTIPESETGNVRLMAAVPGKSASDPVLTNAKLQYQLLVSQSDKDTNRVIDEDSALVSLYTQRTFAGRLDDLLKQQDKGDWGTDLESWLNLGDNAMIRGMLDGMADEMIAAKTYAMPEAKRKALANRLADTVMYHVKFDDAMVDRSQADWQPAEDEKVVTALNEILKLFREGARLKMAAANATTPEEITAVFAEAPFMVIANQMRAAEGKPPVKFSKATDFGDFVVDHYLAINNTARLMSLSDVFYALDVDQKHVPRLKAAQFGMLKTLGFTMFVNPAAKSAFIDLLKEAGKENAAL